VRTRQASLAIAALLAGAAAAWLAANRTFAPYQTASAPLGLLVGWSFIGSGLAAWRVRPDNRLGTVMVFTGFAWFASFLTNAQQALPFTVGTAVESVYLVGLAYLILSFPTGRLRGAIDRAVVWAGVALVTVVELVAMLLADRSSVVCHDCPGNLLAIGRNPGLANGLAQGQRIAGLVLSVFVLVRLVARWSRASTVQRRNVTPVFWAGGMTLVALVVTVGNDVFGGPLGDAAKEIFFLALATLPVAVAVVLLQRRLARAAVAVLVVELGERDIATDLKGALARALGDPSLDVAYWFPQAGRYVDGEGTPVELPPTESGRVCTVVERGGHPVAVLVHDPGLQENRELIDSVCAAAALTLENERLQAELRARLGDLQASRARLVDATEAERRRIERDLHDGTQQRLVSLAMSLGLLDTKLPGDPQAAKPIATEARAALAVALQELRELSQGIHPTVLTERGLGVALEELADRAALPAYVEVSVGERPCPAVEAAAYFVVSEALTNAAKHSHAGEVRIAARDERDQLIVEVADDGIGGAAPQGGSGLRGLTDRVEALGGRLMVSSPPGRGTSLRAEIPCA
jgi:signal transduction histidine kinase